MRQASLILIALMGMVAGAQGYWQQRLNYVMDVTMDHITHKYTGKQVLTYTNNSPEALTHVFYHLYFNAFQPGSAMDVRSRWIDDPDPRVGGRIAELAPNEQGYMRVKSLKYDGRVLTYSENETILEVALDKPIPPGGKAVFEMEFEGQVPLQIRRSGRTNAEGIDYSMSQWYPKLCEYDARGWHPNPYIGREFHGVWGDFEVNITIDKNYSMGATGILQNPEEIGKGYETAGMKMKKVDGPNLTWRWKAQNVHDFVWGADPDYVHETAQVPDGPILHFLYQNDPAYAENWKQLRDKTVKAFQFLSNRFGKYPYPQYSVIQGGDGGMEYPMATLITGNRKLPSLVGVTVHEAVHSWYQGILATNESLYSWMDEGFTSYASSECMDYLFTGGGMPGDHSNAYEGYLEIVRDGKEEALDTHADHFVTNRAFGVASYNKGEVYLAQLEYLIGRDAFDRGMLKYFDTWKFKHPTDEDFLRVMETESGMVLDWYNEYFVHTTKTIDYAVTQVVGGGGKTGIALTRKGEMPMPVEMELTLRDGNKVLYYVPLDLMRGEKPKGNYTGTREVLTDWKWVDVDYTVIVNYPIEQIASITIDPERKVADTDRSNQELQIQSGIDFMLDKR
ncbi:MAG: M1 family metallopeptidase [Flavobacteriales bacterium]